MRLRRAVSAALVLSACASGPQEFPKHEGPLNDAERDAFKKVLAVQESLYSLFDYANLGVVTGILEKGSAKAMYQQALPPTLQLRFGDAKAPYTGTATMELVPHPTKFLEEWPIANLTVGGDQAYQRSHHFLLRLACATDVTFPATGVTFAAGSTLAWLLDLNQTWDSDTSTGRYVPTFKLSHYGEEWSLPAGLIAGVSATGFLAYDHWLSPGRRSTFYGSKLDYALPGMAIPAVGFRARYDGYPVLWIGDVPYDTSDYANALGPAALHRDAYLEPLLGK